MQRYETWWTCWRCSEWEHVEDQKRLREQEVCMDGSDDLHDWAVVQVRALHSVER